MEFYTSKEIKPEGWLKKQLEIQANGLSGNLDKIWPDVKDSAWIGGNREGWERVPYWLDGFIPLAYLLENEDMISRAKKYIDSIIEAQNDDGWICPCKKEERSKYDTWGVQLISKVLKVYYDCSNDERIPEVLYKTLKCYYELLKDGTIKLFDWGKYRWFETFIAIDFLCERYNEEWLKELAAILKEQGIDYKALVKQWERPLNKWSLDTHLVNIVMMLKSEALVCKVLGKEYTDDAEYFRQILDKYNGTVYGSFTGDECLSGISPIQGTELCAIVEQMFSYEILYAYTGDDKWAELLELLAFNALTSQISEDMWTHQYLQMSNQIACEKFPGKSLFRTNNSEAHLFGLEPHFGCCTANFNQGWPKFALATYMKDNDTIMNGFWLPSVFESDGIKIELVTNYPFENSVKYVISTEKDFKFKVRIPSFCQNLKIDACEYSGNELVFYIEEGVREINIEFETIPYFEKRPYGLNAVKCGSLLFSVPISYSEKKHEYEANGVERKFPYCDYELIRESEFSYGYCKTVLKRNFNGMCETPFSKKSPSVTINAVVKKIEWGLEDGYETVCAKIPESRTGISKEKNIDLAPYGCCKLRMTELPFAE